MFEASSRGGESPISIGTPPREVGGDPTSIGALSGDAWGDVWGDVRRSGVELAQKGESVILPELPELILSILAASIRATALLDFKG